ncbi:CynX/NimT family MFS transporter [Natribacillus halophilus]|uniref:MFS transporter, CP family, cyanate transporter n=1 Tax=Natribacillus halophilus TaxID=549003 RepID=A0A1G8QGC7_9BACI|nr:MFS transporter [Natribacillus halophilus]SDJ03698.1 MFS transporter, CP family, cyanate transporter [Natribacillus halophilus]
MKKRILNPKVWIIIAIILVAFNLRPAITGVGPLIGMIREDLQLTNSQAGILTTLPLLAFAGLSIAAPRLARKWGIEWAIFAGLFTLLIGILLRSGGYSTTLFMGTAIIGIGIAICNVLLPGFVKLKFAKHTGVMTSVYTTSMSLFATVGSGLSIPLAINLGLDWQGALVFWCMVTVTAMAVWTTQLRGAQKPEKIGKHEAAAPKLWHSPLAWHVTAFMGLQSMIFYSLVTWLPEIAQANGISAATAGWLLSFTQLCGLPSNFITPILASRLQNQRIIVLVIIFFYFIGFIGLLFVGNSLFLHFIFTFFIGASMGASISLSFILFNLRTTSAPQASLLSGMAQSFGYLLAAIGPILLGFLYDFTGGWVLPLLILTGVSLLLAISGLNAAKDTYVFAEQPVRKREY